MVMLNQVIYTDIQMKNMIEMLSGIFDNVRLVNPSDMTSYNYDNGIITKNEKPCYFFRDNSKRCANCIAALSFAEHKQFARFEFVDDIVYYVLSQYVVVNTKEYVLEMVLNMTDNLTLGVDCENSLISQIAELNHQIYTDALTGISNRRYMDEQLGSLYQSATYDKSSFAVMMLDIDDFMSINDTYGHAVGDEAIQWVASVLQKSWSTSRGDIIARYGGDEFFVGIKDVSMSVLKRRIECVQQKVCGFLNHKISVSAGVYYQKHASNMDISRMLKHADEALYDVKQCEKGSYRIVSE